jgi:hypothetical protein
MSSTRRCSFVLVTAVGVLLSALPGAALAVADASAPSAISITSKLGCVETVIASIHPSRDASGAGSGSIGFRDDIAPGRGARGIKIRSVTLAYTTDVPDMHTGDRVRVCLSFMPTKDVSPQGCDPATDPRGRRFVIVDRVTGTVAQYYDGIHLCGGA